MGSAQRKIGLLGAGSQAREMASYLTQETEVFWALSEEFLDAEDPRQVDICHPDQEHVDTPVIGAVGAPGLRRRLVEMWPGERFGTIISDHAYIDISSTVEPGSLVAPGTTITVGVEIGKHSQVNIGATLSHDVAIGEYVTISPGVSIAGHVELADGVFVGTGANIVNSVSIATGVVVGAGATVITDISVPNAVVIGTPAKIVRVRECWLDTV